MHHYLKEIQKNKPFFREFPWKFRWWRQKIKYGFDDRETYGLDYTFYLWAYERLRMYVDRADNIVDLNYHEIEYDGKTWTERGLIMELLRQIEDFSRTDFDPWEKQNYLEIGKIWAVLLPYLWW